MYLRALGLRRRHGFALDESLAIGLLDPARPVDGAIVSKRETLAVQAALNPAVLEPQLENKQLLQMLLEAGGVPMPALLMTLIHGATGWSWAAEAPVPPDGWTGALDALEGGIVVKPAMGCHGEGVHVLERDGDAWRGPDGRRRTSAALARELADDPHHATWVVQRRVVNHPAMPAFGRSGILSTCRVVTFVNRAGGVEVVWAGFRIAAGEAGVDNFAGGRHGNLSVRVDPATGELLQAFTGSPTGIGLVPVDEGPLGGGRIAGTRLPGWDAVLALADRTARALAPARTLGLDIGITPDGPVIIEVNMWWDPVPHEPLRPVLERLRTG